MASDKTSQIAKSVETSEDILKERKRRIFSFRTLVLIALSLVVVFLLFRMIEPARIVEEFKTANWLFIALAVLMYACSNFAKALRFKIVLSDHKLKMSDLYIITSFHNFFNFILPARTGELTLVYYLNTIANVKGSRGIHSLLVARILDLGVVGIFFLTSFMLYSWGSIPTVLAVGGLALVVLAIAALFMLQPLVCFAVDLSVALFEKLGLTNKGLFSKLKESLLAVKSEFENTHIKHIFFQLVLVSLLVWAILYTLYYFAMSAFVEEIPFLQVVAGATGAVLTNVLPINAVGGLGSYEAGWAGGFILTGLDKATAVATSFTSHIVFFASSFFMAAISFLVQKLFMRK